MTTERQTPEQSLGLEFEQVREYPSALAAWSCVGLLFVLYTISLLDRNLMSLFIPNIKQYLRISDVDVGVLFGVAFALFYAVGALPLGWAIDRFSRQWVIWSGVTLWSMGTIACGIAPGYASFFAARAVVGAGEAVLTPGSQSLLPDMFPKHKLALPLSVYALGNKAGPGLSLIVGGALTTLFLPGNAYFLPLIGSLEGWQIIFIIAALPGLALGLGIFLITDPRRPPTKHSSTSYVDYFRYVLANRQFIFPHHLAMLPLAVVTIGIYTWTPAFLTRVHQWPTDKVGLWLGVALVLGPTISLPIHGFVVDSLFRRGMKDAHLRYLVVSLIVSLPMILGAYLVPTPELCVLLIGLFFATMAGYVSLPNTILQIIVPPAMRGKVASVNLTLVSLFSLTLGPVLAAIVTDHVFADPLMVGWSLILCTAFGIPLSVLGYCLAMKPARELLERTPNVNAQVSLPADARTGRTDDAGHIRVPGMLQNS